MQTRTLAHTLAFAMMLPVAVIGASAALAKNEKSDSGVVQGAAKGAAVGAIIPGVGVATGAAIGAAAGGIKKAGEKSDKKEEKKNENSCQLARPIMAQV